MPLSLRGIPGRACHCDRCATTPEVTPAMHQVVSTRADKMSKSHPAISCYLQRWFVKVMVNTDIRRHYLLSWGLSKRFYVTQS